MAQSTNFLNDIKKELECPVCQEQFSETNEPKVLKCQHTFCKSCLDGWLRQQGGGRLSCPNCRELTECPNNNIDCLPTNLACKNLGDILKAHDGSDGGRDFRSRKENVCKRHKKKVEYYCEQCEICICSGCVIVEHRDSKNHTIVSLEDGVRKQKAIIEGKIKDVAANTTRLRSDIATLVERREKFNSSIEQAANEVHRVAGDCINLIRQHEASVTEQLAMEKSLYDDVISKELSKLTEKLQRMDAVSTLGRRQVLEGDNMEEMLNIKQVLDETITKKATPLLKYPDLKYRPNAVPRNFAPGKLYVTHTEPYLSVAVGEGLTKGIQGKESSFTVKTMDSKFQTTYSEIDKVTVEIKSIRKGTKDIPAVVKDLKDGRYSVSFRPSGDGEFSVSIKVREEPIRGSPFKLLVDTMPKTPVYWEPIGFGGAVSKFKTMAMTDEYWNVTPVQRFDLSKGVELPISWIPQPRDPQGIEQPVHLVQLDPTRNAQEYQEVQNRFQLTCSNQIVKIERVQNPALFGTYMIRKQKMDEAKGSNEQRLFHGTPANNCQLINKTGFNRYFHGRNATVYGNGVYFAKDALYSARSNYSPPDGNGHRYMYLTRVLVGEYTVGRQGLLTPPAKNPNDPTDIYDSVVDQIPNPAIFVIFYDWQCYPEYLITFC